MNLNRNIFYVSAICGVFLLVSCKNDSHLDASGLKIPHYEVGSDTFKAPDLSGFRARVSERFAIGDTVPVSREKLEKLLPEEIEGYTLEIREGGKFNTKEYAFSEATYVFYNEGNEYLEITLADYVADTLFFENPLRRYHLIGGPEFGNEEVKKLEPPTPGMDGFGWVSYHAPSQAARLFFGLNYRYALNIEATGQTDTKTVLDAWSSIPLNSLIQKP